MTLRKLLEKYKRLQKANYETVFINMVVNDLWSILREREVRKIERQERSGKK